MKKIEFNRKDRNPKETIDNISSVLKKYGLSFNVVDLHSVNDVSYSVTVELTELPGMTTNGKGISEEFALASALGEMMERLQCGVMIDESFYGGQFSRKNRRSQINYELIYKYLKNILPKSWRKDIAHLIDKFPQYGTEEVYNKIDTDEACYLPHKLIHYICGSNGTCAGNTMEEAVCQGLSEIYERWALRNIYWPQEAYSFPNISLDTVGGYSKIMIDVLQQKGFTVLVKDCTLGNKIPVLGLLVINSKKNKYAFSLGSDIEFDICLQRCITEMFQGKDCDFSFRYIMKNMWTKESCSSLWWNDAEKSHEYMRNLIDKSGYVPISLFFETDVENRIPSIFVNKRVSNIEAFQINLNICKNNKWEIYIKDFSKTSIYSYRVYIPGISEAFYLPTENWIKIIGEIEKAKIIWSKAASIDKGKRIELVELIDTIYKYERYKNNSISLNRLMGTILYKDEKSEHLFSFETFLFRMYFELGEYRKAIMVLENNLLDSAQYSAIKGLYELDANNVQLLSFPNCPNCRQCDINRICAIDAYKQIVLENFNCYDMTELPIRPGKENITIDV